MKPIVTVIQPKSAEEKISKIRVAAYCRVSSDSADQLNSFMAQMRYYENFLSESTTETLVGIYADEGISGTQARKRPEFLKMIRQCRKKKIDLVITKSISRFARNTVDCIEYVRELKNLGIGVIFEKENLNTLTMTSEFMISLYGSFAQAESESISKNVTWGMQKAYAEGKVAIQYSKLLGYKKGKDNKPEIVPEEAEIIKLIYELFLDGYSMTKIKKTLESKGILTAMGKTVWNESLVKSILQNEKYVGDVLLQKTFTTDCISKKVVKNNGERPMYLISNHHEPIIDRDTFNRAAQELARRSSKRKISDKTKTEQGKYSSKYALSELLICGKCGTPYRRQMWTSNGERYAVWRCISRLNHGTRYCTGSPTVHEIPLHRTILKAVNEYLGCRDDIAKILKANIGAVMECKNGQEILNLENRLKELDKARNDLITLITSGACAEDTLDAEFMKIHDEEKEINEKLLELQKSIKISEDTQSKIDSAMQTISNENFQLDTFDDVIIRKLIECVRVISKDTVQIIFKGEIEVMAKIEK